MGKKKYLLLFVTVIAVIAAGYFYHAFTNTGVNIKTADAVKVTAPALYEAFSNDTSTARHLYLHKIVEVSGTVTRTDQNQQNQTVVLLKTMTNEAAINCTLEGKETTFFEGQQVAIKGLCNGLGEGDADLGIPADLYLLRCYVVAD